MQLKMLCKTGNKLKSVVFFFLKVDMGENKVCFCCEEFHPTKCTEKENALKLYPVKSCSAVHLLLKVPCTCCLKWLL